MDPEAIRKNHPDDNTGDETVSMVAVRVAVLNEDGVPACEWTEVVATPSAVEGPWREPILSG